MDLVVFVETAREGTWLTHLEQRVQDKLVCQEGPREIQKSLKAMVKHMFELDRAQG